MIWPIIESSITIKYSVYDALVISGLAVYAQLWAQVFTQVAW